MAFLAGPECSTASNPLSQFTKHTQADNSLQRDRIVGHPALNGLRESFRTQDGSGEMADRAFDQFLSQPAALPHTALPEFDVEQIRREMENLQPRPLRIHEPPAMGSQQNGFGASIQRQGDGLEELWNASAEFQQRDVRERSPYGVDEYRAYQATSSAQTLHTSQPHVYAPPLHQQRFASPMMYSPSLGAPMMQWPMNQGQAMYNQPQSSRKGKERLVELNDQEWEAQFAQLAQSDQKGQAASAERQSETLHDGDLESLWKGILSEKGDLKTDPQVKVDLSDLDSPDWTDFDTPSFDNLRAFNQEAEMGQYQFEEENPFAQHSNAYEAGLEILRTRGNLTLAALAFEAAVQADEKHAEAWMHLGQTQASNEMESQAIRALERAIAQDPESSPALMSLAISYTNESYDQLALRTLEKWLSVRYPQVLPPSALTPVAETGFTDPDQFRTKVTRAFIRAAQQAPSGVAMDPDVQIGLGVLFYTAGTYSKAIDCFQAALDSTEDSFHTGDQQVHLLWNRLGATLANSARPEEAIAAYERALELNPSFTRARYNLGVSCINMGFLKEAAGHLLGAMAMHQRGEEQGRARAVEITGREMGVGAGGRSKGESANLMETLMRVFRQMDRRDLMDMVVPGMDVESFRGQFDF